MSDISHGLLPIGLYDQLPPFAQAESRALSTLLASFADCGFAQVSPPLLEFEETLLNGCSADVTLNSFRIMDPLSRRMLALRADMTMQIARIATERLPHLPRPLRLSYAGQTMRVQGESLRLRRQFRQVGIEIISDHTLPEGADLEAISVLLCSLQRLGVDGLTLDINTPDMLAQLLAESGLDAATRSALMHQLAQKDTTLLLSAPMPEILRHSLLALVQAAGTASRALPALRAIALPASVAAQRDMLCHTVEALQAQWPTLNITVDAVEARGFEYHHGISFSLFHAECAQEIGRGGRYMLREGIEATGATLYLDALQPVLPPLPTKPSLLMSTLPDAAMLQALQQEYHTVLAALGSGGSAAETLAQQAKLAGCSHYYFNGAAHPAAR